jgi:hypothetical protein
MSGKVTNNIHCMARSTLLPGNEVDCDLFFLIFPDLSENWYLYLILNL